MAARRRWRVVVTLALVAAAAAVAASAAIGASGGPVLPTSDPFYAAPANLASLAPGAVIRRRTVAIRGALAAFPATQVLYRTQNEAGTATATVATIIRPLAGVQRDKLVSWQTFYDGLGAECRPSYTLQGGNGGYDASTEEALMLPYLTAGYPVVTADYEGPNDEWVAGQESGENTLDGIRAAESSLALPAAQTGVGMLGYSGGAIATEWAAELASTYAPELHFVGAAAGGVPVDLEHNLGYINGSQTWSGVIPPVILALGQAFGVDLTPYLSAYGVQQVDKVRGGCINNFLGAFPGLRIQQMLGAQYQNPFSVRPIVQILNRLIMSTGGTPRMPMFLGNGIHDGIGDDVMIAGDVEGLAHTYCERGVPVQFKEFQGDSHTPAAVPFEANALSFLEGRFAGTAFASGCASIGTGNALTPLPVPAAAPAPVRLKVTLNGVRARRHGFVIHLRAVGGTLRTLTVTLARGKRTVSTLKVTRLGTARRGFVLRTPGGQAPPKGSYTLTASSGGTRYARLTVRVR